MYSASVPPLRHILGALDGVLRKGEAFATARKIDPAVLLQARLAPDMLPLLRQVQIASDQAKGCGARLAGIEVPRYEDVETTFAELYDRIARTRSFLEAIAPSQIDGSEERPIVLTNRHGELRFTGQDYLFQFVMPNVHFHCTIAYAILRHNGVDVGKRDFLGGN
jgi:hypothetical protein